MVRSARDHYPENILYKKIVRSLKRYVANLVWYLGPQVAVGNILVKT